MTELLSSGSSDRVAVIGGGLGGLAAACTLAARGHKVTLLEANDWLGGKAAVLHQDGYRFDMGPTILTVPRVLARLFEEAGRNVYEDMDLIRLDPQWRCFFEGGDTLDLHEGMDAMRQELEAFSGDGAASGYESFVELSQQLHEISDRFFFWKSVEGIRDTLDLGSTFDISTLRDLMTLRMGQTVAGTIRKHVEDHRVSQMLDHFTQYVGSSPYGAPAVLCSIAHMQLDGGVWYPRGGTRAVPEALQALAERLGVEVRTGVEVSKILVEEGAVTGIETAAHGSEAFGAVVSNMDAVRTYRELVGGSAGAAYASDDKYEAACSGVVLYLGLKERYDHLLHHNFVFSRDPEEEFDWIYKRGEPAPDPTCYVAAPSCSEPEVAPAGGEALYVLVHTPYLRPGHDWSKMLPAYRQRILDKLKGCAGLEDIEDRIETEATLTPQDIHERYRVLNGAIYGLASHGRFFGAFKPGNRSREIEGLYLAGGAAHPGPGMPMVMMSGWIAADSLDADRGGESERRSVA
jgi:phytoene desaturase